jgi:hypothetical protein
LRRIADAPRRPLPITAFDEERRVAEMSSERPFALPRFSASAAYRPVDRF